MTKPKTYAYLPDGREVQTIILYGTADNPHYERRYGPPCVLVGVPKNAELKECPDWGGLELFLPDFGHIAADALLSFAREEDDDDFHVVRTAEGVVLE